MTKLKLLEALTIAATIPTPETILIGQPALDALTKLIGPDEVESLLTPKVSPLH